VACPFFMPTRTLDRDIWINPPRLPLGEPYYGTCVARPSELYSAPETVQRDFCNCGYARGECGRFPEDSAADAVRFSIKGDSGGRLRLVYVVEKDHAPVEHGEMEYDGVRKELVNGNMSELLKAQARAFAESYVRRRV
jgi:hypothetical protein